MSDNMQAKVLSMLENYISNARMIALLRFELDHSFRVSAEDAISAMNLPTETAAARQQDISLIRLPIS